MKKLLLILLMCIFAIALIAQEKSRSGVENHFNSLETFNELNNETIANITIVQADSCSIGFLCDEATFKAFSYKVSNGVLHISADSSRKVEKNFFMCKITITTPKLISIKNNGVGSINIDFENDSVLNVENYGVGDIKIKTRVKSLIVSNEGVGNVYLEGSAENLKIKNSGVGNVESKNFISQRASVENLGIGSVNVHADSLISVTNEGFGKVKVYGNPSKQELNGKTKRHEKSEVFDGKKSSKRSKQKISPYLGVRLGFNNYLSNGQFVDGIAKVRSGASLSPAIVIGSKWKFCKRFWLNSELTFSWYNFKFADASVRYSVDTLGNQNLDYSTETNIKYLMSKMTSCYINLELCPTVKIARHFSVGAGGFVGYNLMGRNKYKYEIDETKFKNRVKANCFSELRYGVKAEITYSLLTLFFEYDFANVYKNLQCSGSEIKANPLCFGLKLSF